MPQLDVSTFASQIFWLVVTFFMLYVIMAQICLPRIRQVLQDRQGKISGELEMAEQMKKEAEASKADYTSLLESAQQKAGEVIAQAEAKVAEELRQRHEALDATLAKRFSEAETRIQATKQEVLEAMKPVAFDFANTVLKDLIKVDVPADKIKKSIENLAQEDA